MKCSKCGNTIKDTDKFCPYCGNNSLGSGNNKQSKKIMKKPKLMIPIISLILSVVMFAGSVTGWAFSAFSKTEAASDVKTDGKVVSDASSETQYDKDTIEKKQPDVSGLVSATPNETGAKAVRQELSTIKSSVDQALAEVTARYPEVTGETQRYYVNAAARAGSQLRSNSTIDGYYTASDNVIFDLKYGGYYVYAPHVDGYNSGGIPELKISTFQPTYTTGQYDNCVQYRDYVDNGAKILESNLSPYVFNAGGGNDADYNDSEVDAVSSAGLGAYSVILWDGHGCYNSHFGSLMCLGEKRTEQTDAKYHDLLMSGDLLYGDDTYFIGPDFIKNRIPDGALDNSVIYIGTCSGGYGGSLPNALLAKGAEAVYAADNSIRTVYNAKMTQSICEGLTQKNSDGSLYNVEQALEYAKRQNGETDGSAKNTRVRLFTNNKEFALDWYEDHIISERDIVLVLDMSGSMHGTPLDETKKAAKQFVETVLVDNVRIGVVTYDDTATVLSDFSMRKQTLISQIDSIRSGGSTNIDAALQEAESMLDKSKAKKKIIVLMSDGVPNSGRVDSQLVDYADTIKSKGVYLYTLGFFNSLSGSSKARAQQLMGDLATEGYHYEVDDADNLVYFFGDIADLISGQKYIYIEIACPVNVKVPKDGETLNSADSKMNTRTSFGVLSFEAAENTDEDNSEDGSTKKILRLKDGMEYDIEIEGTGKGKMDYTIQYMDEKGDYTDKRTFSNIKITNSTAISTVAASARNSTVLNVDEDGDGRYDITYKAEKNGKGREVSKVLQTVLFYVAIICFVWIFASIVFLVIQVKRREKYLAQTKVA